ncbi:MULTISPECIES: membrane-targeted effector domain-containing toxin [unclassified Pseudomonas]|uniref:membrane-targeted effector domain-containing toxin n=1 Tax=unclassified Pseudomonas TaxID=196821 RepID=UPI00249CDF2C|nr:MULTISPECIES: membrane-targeted effector domain-containing toxin [unclassified Pseudomonas]MDI3250024.1 membrane-targeted effector domain-containing toxin [Pseudomonas sp. AL10]MDI3265892.1 membrane-targeted effector domain-containing toxin [Pseudomonas sp. AL15]
MIIGITHPRPRRDVSTEETAHASEVHGPSLPEVEAIAPVSANRSDLIKGLQITDQRLLLNQYQKLNQDIQALLLRQPTLSSVIEQQLARSLGIAPPVDVSSLYVHRYHTDEQGQRKLVSVEGITEALFNALRQLKTSPDAEPSTSIVGMEVGFYRSDSPSESPQQLQTRDTLLSIAQAIEKELPLSLARFWTEPRTGEPNPESPQNELLGIHREMLSTLAALGVEDGALTPAAKSLIDKTLEYPTLEARESAMRDGERPGVYPLKLEVPSPAGSLLAGAFLITSSDGASAARPFDSAQTDRTLSPGQQHGLTVLYTPRDGYETFESPAKALAALRQRINDDPDAAEQLLLSLPIEVQQGLRGDWKNQLSQNLSPVEADVIAAGVPQLLARQRQQVVNALQALYDRQSVEPELVDPWRHLLTEADVHHAADLGPHFDGSSALEAREQWLDSPSRSIDARQALDQNLGNQKNWRYLAQKLNESAQALSETPTERDVSAILKKTPMNIAPDSAHYQAYIRVPGLSVSLEAFITEHGLPLPKTRDELLALAQTAKARAQQHPLGNFSGGLSWPIPLDAGQQQTLRMAAVEHVHSDPELPQEIPKRGVLEHLGRNLHLSEQTLEDPVKVLETLISSKDGQALGQAMQTKMNGIATDSSANDYALAAIQLLLDPESLTAPQRNHVAGFDLADKKHWGQRLSTIVYSLRQHLIDTGRESPELAGAAAHLLLSRAAPHLLVKNIPDSVVYGSTAWANLCMATAAIEAKTPGRVATMSFAEVMITADTAGAAPASAQAATMLDWAVANDILPAKDDALYQPADLDKAQTLFKAQLDKLMEASSLIGGSFPSRKQMALDLLLKTFGPGMDFELKIFSKYNGDTPSNPRSLLEIVMEERVMDGRWELTKENTGVDLNAIIAFTKGASFNIQRAFEDAFSTALDNHKTVKKTSILNALSNLPPEDRKNLTQGKLNYFQEKSYRVSWMPFKGETLFHTSPTILVTAQHNGQTTTYEFDTVNGVVRSLGKRKTPKAPEAFANELIREEPFYPDRANAKRVDGWQTLLDFLPNKPVPVSRIDLSDFKESELDREQPSTAEQPYMLINPRSHHIADSVIKALELDNPAIKKAAAGTTTFESNQEILTHVTEFFLNLIPFRSAIVNFMEGNYGEGITDVAFDVFGFVTAGVGMAAKIGKVLGTAGSAVSKALKVTKIMVPSLLKELNPLNGVGDLLKGAGKTIYEGTEAIAGLVGSLKGTANREALISAASRYEAAATGTFKVSGNSVEGMAVKRDGRWYAYDAHKQKAFGAPQDFDPVHTLMPPSPRADFSPRGQVSARQNSRFHPYKKPIEKTPNIDARTPTTPVIVNKTDHLDSIKEEYVVHIKGRPNEGHFTPSRRKPTEQRFEAEMNDFHQKLDPLDPPNRPTIPETKPYEKVPDLIEKALDNSDVVIFGESHQHLAMFREIDASIELFKRKNVKVVGIEGVVYDNRGLLKDDGMGHTGPNLRPAHPQYNLQTLIKKFQDAGIEVVPLDHFYLTRHRHDRNAYTKLSTTQRNLKRLKEFNYYAARVIEQHKHKGKVVALVGRQHINTTQGVTGLAEATGGIGIGVYERTGMKVGYGTNSKDIKPGPMGTLNADNDLAGDLQIYSPAT